MTMVRRGASWQRRPTDRAQAGELLRPLIRRASPGIPVVVGVGVGGLAVAERARAPRSPLGALGVEEFDLPDAYHPGTSSGAVSATGRVLLRSPALDRLDGDAGGVRKAVRDTQMLLGSGLLPAWYGGPDVRDRRVVLVDDGSSSPSRLAAAVDFIRRDRPLGVVLAVACSPLERVNEMEEFAGEVVVAVAPPWSVWFGWHGQLYESDRLLPYAEIGRLLRA